MYNFEEIKKKMLTNYEANAGVIADDATDANIKISVVANEIAELYKKLSEYENQAFADTATGDFLKRHGEIRGIFKKTATHSYGNVTFYKVLGNKNIIKILPGTLCTSSLADGILFEVCDSVTISADQTSAVCLVRSLNLGYKSSISAGLIDTLASPIVGIDHIKNLEKISGGGDEETDEQFRKRIIDTYRNTQNGANSAYYERIAKENPEVWFAKAVADSTNSNVLNLYVENLTRTISDDCIAKLSSTMENARAVLTKVNVAKAVKKPINIDIKVKIDAINNEPFYTQFLVDKTDEIIANIGIGESFSPTVTASKLLMFDGISDISFVSPTCTIPLAKNEICTLGTFNIVFEV